MGPSPGKGAPPWSRIGRSALKALVKRKAAGKTIEVPEEKEEQSNVIDLMDALKQSSGSKKAPAPQAKGKKREPARRGRNGRAA